MPSSFRPTVRFSTVQKSLRRGICKVLPASCRQTDSISRREAGSPLMTSPPSSRRSGSIRTCLSFIRTTKAQARSSMLTSPGWHTVTPLLSAKRKTPATRPRSKRSWTNGPTTSCPPWYCTTGRVLCRARTIWSRPAALRCAARMRSPTAPAASCVGTSYPILKRSRRISRPSESGIVVSVLPTTREPLKIKTNVPVAAQRARRAERGSISPLLTGIQAATAVTQTVPSNAMAVARCASTIMGGNSKRTVIAPSATCRMSRPNAAVAGTRMDPT